MQFVNNAPKPVKPQKDIKPQKKRYTPWRELEFLFGEKKK